MTAYESIDAKTLMERVKVEELIIIDVREPGEYRHEHIAGAVNIPVAQFCVERLAAYRDKHCVISCQAGVRAQNCLQRLPGCENPLSLLKGGLNAWKAAGGDTVKASGACVLSIMQQVQLIVGVMVVLGVVLALTLSPFYALISGFFGLGLIFAGLTGTCGMAKLLSYLPFNR